MTQPGASAALRGYRLQALYTLKRVLSPGVDETRVYCPEGAEDLGIKDQTGQWAEVVQVKSYPGLTLSDLEPDKTDSFLHRAISLLQTTNPPVIKLVNFGALFGFMLLHLAVVWYYLVKNKSRNFLLHLIVPVIGFLIIGYVLINAAPEAKIGGLVWLVLGAGVFLFRFGNWMVFSRVK